MTLKASVALLLMAFVPSFAYAQGQPARSPQPAAPAPRRVPIAFFQLEAQHIDPKTAAIVSDEIHAQLSRMPGSKVIGSKDIDAMLGYEQKKQMAGCTDTGCMVAIGGALGVDKIVVGSIGKLGESHLINLKLLDVKQGEVEHLYSKRIKGGKEEDFLDLIPEALATLFPASAEIWVKPEK